MAWERKKLKRIIICTEFMKRINVSSHITLIHRSGDLFSKYGKYSKKKRGMRRGTRETKRETREMKMKSSLINVCEQN